MKLRNTLCLLFPGQLESPYIGLSFTVGYNRLAISVGRTIICSIKNTIRGDVDSEVFNCLPASGYMLRQKHLAENVNQRLVGPLWKFEKPNWKLDDVVIPYGVAKMLRNGRSAVPIKDDLPEMLQFGRGALLGTGRVSYGGYLRDEMVMISAAHNLHERFRFANYFNPAEEPRLLDTFLMTNLAYRRKLKEDFKIKEQRNAGKFRLSSAPGGHVDIPKVIPPLEELAALQVVEKVHSYLSEKYAYTGEGMIDKHYLETVPTWDPSQGCLTSACRVR